MLHVKICGLTNLGDARHAARCGADMLGFIFADSPRRVEPDCARAIIDSLRAEGFEAPTPVGVFVDAPEGDVISTCVECGIATAQLSGGESPDFCRMLTRMGIAVIKAFHIRDKDSIRAMYAYDAVDYFLCDTFDPDRAGGTGRAFDHSLVAGLSEKFQMILAGGLNCDNVADAVARVRPWGVDVASGVEAEPGKKDPAKVEAFIRKAKG